MKATITVKKCAKCKELLSLSEYHIDKQKKDELRYECKRCCRSRMRSYYLINNDKIKTKNRKYSKVKSRKDRLRIIELYGGRCTCCEERRVEFLTLDHIDGKGNQHRKELGISHYLSRILSEGYQPDKYRILCMNCNWSIGKWGYCPHGIL